MFDRHHVVRGVLFMEFAFPNYAAKLKEPEATAIAGGLLVVRDAAAIYEQAVKILARKSRRNQFTRMGNVVGVEAGALDRAPRSAGQRYGRHNRQIPLQRQRRCHAQNRRAHVAAHQPVLGQVARQSHGIQFVDRVHNFGNGCAVTNRGVPPPGLIYHALRTFKRVPSGAVNGPSTT